MHPEAGFGFLPERGEMAQRIRAFDWRATSLGEPEQWPENLRTSLSLCLSSRFPILIWWGPDMRVLYNDAYIPFLGTTKHPAALGQPGAQCWSEIWGGIGPMLESVYRTGEATWSQDEQYFFDRALPREEVYVTFTYGPILATDGITVEGVFCPCTETTEKILGARRLETLRRLGLRSTEARGVQQACEKICDVLAESRHDVPFVLIYRCCVEEEDYELQAAAGLEPWQATGMAAWPFKQAIDSQQAVNVDLLLMGQQLPGAPWPECASWARVVPLNWADDGKINGFMVLGVSPRRPLDAGYCAFLDLVASHSAAQLRQAWRVQAMAELDRAKTVFFSNVSHEFRTPLTLMLGPLEDAIHAPGGELQPGQTVLLHRNALRLQKLVNTLLDFSRVEAQRLEASFEPVDLKVLTEELAGVFRSAIEDAGLQLYVRCESLPELLYVDRDMYEKIVLNLISNAFKFTLQGCIEVGLEDAGEHVELRVSDTGCGIADENLPRVFERFYRIEGQAARTHEGTGIGLALVQELVRLHAGSLQVHSQLAQGSTFTVRLRKGCQHLPGECIRTVPMPSPTTPKGQHYLQEALRWLPSALPAGKAGSAPGRGDVQLSRDARARIVCADDNADMREYLQGLLAAFYEVEAVADGLQALELIRQRPPQLVIADVMMPGLDGFGLLQALRNNALTRNVPVLLLSARAGEEAQIEGIHSGADDYLIKPFSSRELLARVKAQLRLASLREQTNAALRANERRLRAIIEQLPAGVGVSDLDGRWVLTNTLMERFAPGVMPSTLPDAERHWSSWDAHGIAVPRENWPGRRALRGEMVLPGMEMLHHPEPDKEQWVRMSAAPLIDDSGNVVGACSIIQDIHQLKQAEQELRNADRRKNEFLAVLAHELRNPLAPIMNGLELLRLADGDADKLRLSHVVLERQVNHMARLVDDLLDISRITVGKIQLHKEVVDATQIVRHAVEASRNLIESRGHQLILKMPQEGIVLYADAVRLTQVIVNLLNNAAKYTPDAGAIVVTAHVEPDHAILCISDSGIGIPSDQLAGIFEMFTQVELPDHLGKGGLGVGLTLARTLVELHGGSIEARSAGVGQGSQFLIRLPLYELSAIPVNENSQASDGTPSRIRRVLIVDDNRDAAEILAMLLDEFGADTQTAHDGPGAIELAQTWIPDVVLLDIGLPGMNGFEVAEVLRSDPKFDRTALIAVTGWAQSQLHQSFSEAGFQHHLVKPVKAEALERILLQLSIPQSQDSSVH